MHWILEFAGPLTAMLAGIGLSAFFSGSEAALFLLRRQDCRRFRQGKRSERIAAALLESPDRLLTAVLFWNLTINIVYFAIASMIGLRLENQGQRTQAGLFTLVALLAIVFFSEMLPKALAVLNPRLVARAVAIPLATAVRLVDPLAPALRLVDMLVRRLVAPHFRPEPYLATDDLARAIRLSTDDAALLDQEQVVLANIVGLSQLPVTELMRPRTWFRSFRPPVALADLQGELPPSGYLLVTEPDGDEITSAIPISYLSELPSENLEQQAVSLIYLPWCATIGQALDSLRRHDRRVLAVVNETGATIGILTLETILKAIWADSPGLGPQLGQAGIETAGENRWRVAGMTTLRQLHSELGVELPTSKVVTVAGALQDRLQRMPRPGDQCQYGPWEWTVLEAPNHRQILVELRPQSSTETEDPTR